MQDQVDGGKAPQSWVEEKKLEKRLLLSRLDEVHLLIERSGGQI
jgi:hypothetical protein